jgi:hypothetical protein
MQTDDNKILMRQSRIWYVASCPLLVIVAAALGCGSASHDMAAVKGKVLLDGQPLTKGHVGTIPPAGRGAHGNIQPDGTFELQTFANSDGALIGTHKVRVAAYDSSGPRGPESEYGTLLVPQHYTNPETSGLTIEVTEDGPNEPVLELSSK